MKRRYPTVRLEREAGQLVIDWPDGHHGDYALGDVRAACPCADCNAYRANPDPLKVKAMPSVQVRNINYVGNYAIQFVWEDGHSFGLYPWEVPGVTPGICFARCVVVRFAVGELKVSSTCQSALILHPLGGCDGR